MVVRGLTEWRDRDLRRWQGRAVGCRRSLTTKEVVESGDRRPPPRATQASAGSRELQQLQVHVVLSASECPIITDPTTCGFSG